jgi:hypothetical protein
MSPAELAIDLAEQRKQGTPPDDLSRDFVPPACPVRQSGIKANAANVRLHGI